MAQFLRRSCVAGEVVLVDIEDSSSVHRLNVKAEVTSLSWAAHIPEEPTKEDTIFQVRRKIMFVFHTNLDLWISYK